MIAMVACVEVVLAVAFLVCRVWFFLFFSFTPRCNPPGGDEVRHPFCVVDTKV